MTTQECEAEIKAVTGGAFGIPKEMEQRLIKAAGELIIAEGATPILNTIMKKRGRPKGSKNKSKI